MRIPKEAAALAALLFAGAASASAPSLEGVWVVASPRPLQSLADHKTVPFTGEGRAKFNENKALAAKRDYSFDYTVSRCSSPGLPRMMLTTEPFKIIQRADIVVAVFKWNQLVRQIDLRETVPPPPSADAAFAVPTMRGDTTGRWEGNTLVARSTGFSADKLIDNLLPNSDQLELTERLTLVDANTLEDRITVTDPAMYSRPWEAVITYKRLGDDQFPFAEDVCLDRKMAGRATWPR